MEQPRKRLGTMSKRKSSTRTKRTSKPAVKPKREPRKPPTKAAIVKAVKAATKQCTGLVDGDDKLVVISTPISRARRAIIGLLESGPMNVAALATRLDDDYGISKRTTDRQLAYWLVTAKSPPIKRTGDKLSLVLNYKRPGFRRLPTVVK